MKKVNENIEFIHDNNFYSYVKENVTFIQILDYSFYNDYTSKNYMIRINMICGKHIDLCFYLKQYRILTFNDKHPSYKQFLEEAKEITKKICYDFYSKNLKN
jgi:hypothetical protein